MTTLTMLAALSVVSPVGMQEETNIGRVFTKGEKLTYAVRSHLSAEARGGEIRTWMPEDLDIAYDFSFEVKEMKADGIAVLHYLRPKMMITEGETMDSPPKTQTEKVNFDLMLTVSPVNEIIEFKENAKKPPAKTIKKNLLLRGTSQQSPLQAIISQFVGEMYRLSLFSGSLDTSLDFSPKLRSPLVAVGDTWHKTVGYQPQKKSSSGKNVVQRLDYEYTYKGPVTINGKKFQRVEATLDLKTDLTEFIKDTYGADSEDTGVAKLPLTMKSKIIFNLDPVTRHAHSAEAETEGGYQIFASGLEGRAIQEARMKGRTLLKLVSRTAPVKK